MCSLGRETRYTFIRNVANSLLTIPLFFVSQIFLSAYNHLDMAVTDKKKPGWVSSYNFASLLNLPQAMEGLGPLVDLWEGKYQGEGIVAAIKQALPNGLRVGWQHRLLTNLLQDKAVKSILRRYDEDDEKNRRDQSLHYHSYASDFELRREFASRKPLSAILLADGSIACVIKGTYLMSLVPTDGTLVDINAMEYHLWDLLDQEALPAHIDVVGSLLFLPGLVEPRRTGLYTVINSRWEEYRQGGEFRLPENLTA